MKIAVRFEGTLAECGEGMIPRLDNLAALKLLHDAEPSAEFYVVSEMARSSLGLQRLRAWLVEYGVDFADAWSGFALPEHDIYYDDNARSLADATT